MIKWLTVIAFITLSLNGFSQGVQFGGSDSAMTRAFAWAKTQALHYRGKPGDPVGPWYESALPPRNAFCMRDVSHQCIGAEILGLSAENKNMFQLFAKNISASKDWCSYWEIDKTGNPAPADYRSDKEFWYNLDANFDVIYATWRLAAWTGDSSYIDDTVFRNFQEKSVGPYIDSWVLQPDSLLSRPAHPNAPIPYHEEESFDRCRGLPSYSEGIPNMKMGVDLLAALYRGLLTYANILLQRGQRPEAASFIQRADAYRRHVEAEWWNDSLQRYNTWYSNDGQFGMGEGETFLLWFDILQDTSRTRRTLEHLTANPTNVESLSYMPSLYYREGDWDRARQTILHLSNPHTERREYPEVAYGVIQGIVLGLMGIDPLPTTRTLTSLYRNTAGGEALIKDLPVLGTTVTIRHKGHTHSTLTNTGKRPIVWRASFAGVHSRARLGNRFVTLRQKQIAGENFISYTDLPVAPGQTLELIAQ